MHVLLPPPADEPKKTIFGDLWRTAMVRLSVVERAGAHARLQALVDHLVEGWGHARQLQQLVETYSREGGTGFVHPLLEYIEDFLIDKYRTLVFEALDLIPHGPEPAPESIELEGDAVLFYLMLVTVHLSADSPLLPDPLRAAIRSATTPLLDWPPKFAFLVAQVSPAGQVDPKEGEEISKTYN